MLVDTSPVCRHTGKLLLLREWMKLGVCSPVPARDEPSAVGLQCRYTTIDQRMYSFNDAVLQSSIKQNLEEELACCDVLGQ